MIEIKKGNEPKELLQYRQRDFATYADMPSDVKKKVIEGLLSEQGHLCAYCMSRIDGGDGKHRATIEHCIPQSVSAEKERLNYKNMVAVCWGNRDAHSNDDKSCDAKRGSLPLEQQDMKRLNLNCEACRLKECRLQALRTLHRMINQKYPNKTVPKKYLQELLAHYIAQNENREPYSGIMIAWLSKKV
ncbi:MAG: hypothetical protein HFI16_02140 [Lachnospiraceae bacterium]|nr:hypothetical protein [Lachnospiraceae bacterium]